MILAIVITVILLSFACLTWYEMGRKEGYKNGVADTEKEMQKYLGLIYKSDDDWK